MRWPLSGLVRHMHFGAMFFACLLGVLARAAAQGPPVSTEIVTSENGERQFTVFNHSSVPVTAIFVTDDFFDPSRNRRVMGSEQCNDIVIDSQPWLFAAPMPKGYGGPLIMPGESATWTHGVSVSRLNGPPRTDLRAAIFKDGSSFGDPAWVQVIVNT